MRVRGREYDKQKVSDKWQHEIARDHKEVESECWNQAKTERVRVSERSQRGEGEAQWQEKKDRYKEVRESEGVTALGGLIPYAAESGSDNLSSRTFIRSTFCCLRANVSSTSSAGSALPTRVHPSGTLWRAKRGKQRSILSWLASKICLGNLTD